VDLVPVALKGRWLTLEPLEERHAPDLFEVMQDEEVWLLDVRPADRAVEIGSTFLARALWRTPANTEAKYLFLTHCFETLGCVRVALKTGGRNARSQEAIARLGAAREGVLRRHMRVRGFQRDTVYYSILDDEWPVVTTRLAARLYGSAHEP
jgi:hypothetical protein